MLSGLAALSGAPLFASKERGFDAMESSPKPQRKKTTVEVEYISPKFIAGLETYIRSLVDRNGGFASVQVEIVAGEVKRFVVSGESYLLSAM
jgi:hypothetical protein